MQARLNQKGLKQIGFKRKGFKQTAIALSIAQLIVMPSAQAAIFNANTVDELRVHINTANSQAGHDVINITSDFDDLEDGAGNLVPFVTSEITMNGNSHSINRLTSNFFTPNFRFLGVSGFGDLTINDLTFSGGRLEGYKGGAIHVGSDANLTLNRVTLSGNTIVNAGGNIAGGALYIAGTATINDSTISDNNAWRLGNDPNVNPRGGGIAASDSAIVTISNSTIVNNRASYGSGAGIFAYKSTVTLINSTVSGNSAHFFGGGILAQGKNTSDGTTRVYLENSTLSGNSAASGGGIRSVDSRATITLSNSIVANSTGGDCSIQSSGRVNSDSVSILEGGGCATNARAIDPQLDPLADNYGRTQSHRPNAASPARNSGVNCESEDQRGVIRTAIDAQCDVGSVELNPNPIVVTTLGDNAGQDASACSVREALDTIHIKGLGCGVASDLDVPEITFAPELNAGVITLERGSLVLDRVDVSIDASALNDGITVDADKSSRVFEVQFSDLFIDNMTITGGVVFNLNRGGGIFASSSTVSLNNSTVSGNTATFFGGGGIASTGGNLELANSTVSENLTNSSGGGIRGNGTSIDISNSTLSGNSARYDGGGLYTLGGTVANIINSTLSNNTADRTGGGLFVKGSSANLMNSIIANSMGGSDCVTTANGATPGTITSDSNSIGEDGTCGSARARDPLLLPLEDNGGPTKTHALLEGSPAINQGNNTVCSAAPINSVDQRGVARPVGIGCDVGAYEGSIGNSTFFIVPLPNGKRVIFGL